MAPSTDVWSTNGANDAWGRKYHPDPITGVATDASYPCGLEPGQPARVDGTTYPGLGTPSNPAKVTVDKDGISTNNGGALPPAAYVQATDDGTDVVIIAKDFEVCGDFFVLGAETTLVDPVTLPATEIVIKSATKMPSAGRIYIGIAGVGLGIQMLNYTNKDTSVAGRHRLTGLSGGAGFYAAGVDVAFKPLIDPVNSNNVWVSQPRAKDFVPTITTLAVQQDLNNLPGMAAAQLDSPDGLVRLVAKGRGTLYNDVWVEFKVSGVRAATQVTSYRVQADGTTRDTTLTHRRKIVVYLKSADGVTPTSTATEVVNAINNGTKAPEQDVEAPGIGVNSGNIVTASLLVAGTVAVMSRRTMINGADGSLQVADASLLPASGFICVHDHLWCRYGGKDLTGGTHKLTGFGFAYYSNSSGGFDFPALNVSDLVFGTATRVWTLPDPLHTEARPASGQRGLVQFKDVRGQLKNFRVRFPLAHPAVELTSCLDFKLKRYYIEGSAKGDGRKINGNGQNVAFEDGTFWLHPGAENGAEGAHIDLSQVTLINNVDAAYGIIREFVPVGRSVAGVFGNQVSATGVNKGLIWRDCLIQAGRPDGAKNTWDLHACDGFGAISTHLSRIASYDDGATGPTKPFLTTPGTLNTVNPDAATDPTHANYWDDGFPIPGPFSQPITDPPINPPPSPGPDPGGRYLNWLRAGP